MSLTEQDIPVDALVQRIRTRNRRESRTAAFHAALMLLLSVFGNWPLMRMGVGLMAVVRAVALAVLWRHDVAIEELVREDRSGAFLPICEVEIRFLRTVKYWYSLPMVGTLVVLAVAFWLNTHSALGPILCAIAGVLLLVGTYRLNDQRGVAEIERTRQGFQRPVAL